MIGEHYKTHILIKKIRWSRKIINDKKFVGNSIGNYRRPNR